MMDRNVDTRHMRVMRPQGFSESFLRQVEADAERRKPSAIRAGTTERGTPIIRCALTPVYDRSLTEIVDVRATVYRCPGCGREHTHRIQRDFSAIQRKDLATGKRALVRLTAPCGMQYCLTPYDEDRQRMQQQLAANTAFLRKRANEQAQARAELQRFLTRQRQQASR